LRREEAAQVGQGGGWVEIVGVCGFVVYDPPAIFSCGVWDRAGAEDPVHPHRAQAAADDADPTDFAGGLGVGRENPLADGVGGGVERVLKRLGGDLRGLRWVHARGADLRGDARSEALKSGAGGGPVAGLAQVSELFEERVDGRAQGAGKRTALVTGVQGRRG